MAPMVVVPADFGRHHIGAPSHGNLAFNLSEGLQIKANSIILSLNSPVIDHLTTDLHLTSLDADDFSRVAVDCFIEASYTGEMEAVNLDNFRDVNKMSHVFRVSWLSARCEKYFVSYLDKLDSQSSYTDLLFAVEEAVYLLSSLKKRDFLNLVVKKMSSIAVTQRDTFINRYLSDLVTSTKHQIDVCIAIVQSDVRVLAVLLISHLEKHDNNSLDENSRYLLQHIDFGLCFKRSPEIHSKLFNTLEELENVCKEDYKLFVRLHKQSSSKQKSAVPFSFPSFKPLLCGCSIYTVLDNMLACNKQVTSLYMLFDGLWSWLDRHTLDNEWISLNLINKMIKVKEERCWPTMDYEYVNRVSIMYRNSQMFVRFVMQCNQLVSKGEGNVTSYTTICEYSRDEFVHEVLCSNKDVRFRFENSKYADQEFILSMTSMRNNDPDTFVMEWSSSYLEVGTDTAPNLHIAIERFKDNEWSLLPITWCGKPTRDKTNTYWNWGYNKFHTKNMDELEMCIGKEGPVNWNHHTDIEGLCRFIVFVIDNH